MASSHSQACETDRETGWDDVTLESVDSGRPCSIPLNRLQLSAQNVRTLRDPDSIPALAATILAAGGLINPLSVVPERRKGVKGACFGVIAGGRRLAALQWLAERGRVPADVPVSCHEFETASAVGISLTENASQEAMHPADQLAAFKKLMDAGRTAGQIAAAFGVSTLTVERRLRLAGLAPRFLQMYRENQIGDDQLQALALSHSHDEQVAVWEALPAYSRSGYQIRALLTREEISAGDRLALFVGLEAYRDAGGTVRTDLFSEDDGDYLQDADMLHRLVLERLGAVAISYRGQGWKWVEVREEFGYAEQSKFQHLAPQTGTPDEGEREAIEQIEAQARAINERLETLSERAETFGETPELEAEWLEWEAQGDAHAELLGAMKDALAFWSDEQKGRAGVVVSVGRDGGLQIDAGLLRLEDARADGKGAGSEAAGMVRKNRPEFSAALCRSMTAHRTAAVAAALTQNPEVALASLLATLIVSDRLPWVRSPLNIRVTSNEHEIKRLAAGYAASPTAGVLERADALTESVDIASDSVVVRLLAFELPQLLRLLAVYVARSYSVCSDEPAASERIGSGLAREIEAALGLDMADWWAPGAECFLSHVPKAKMVQAVAEACGLQAAAPIAKMKKDAAIAAAAAALEGRRWLPLTLRPYPAPVRNHARDDGADVAQAETRDDE